MAKLTDAQLLILSAAAQRADGAALPLPKTLKLQGAAATRVLGGLAKAKLLAERPAALEAAAWRTVKDGRRFMLVIAAAGRQAIGLDAAEAEPEKTAAESKRPRRQRSTSSSTATPPPAAAAEASRPASKQAQVIALLRRPEGATLEALMEATGWRRHTVRGAISGALKKKLGLAVAAETAPGRGRVYRIAGA